MDDSSDEEDDNTELFTSDKEEDKINNENVVIKVNEDEENGKISKLKELKKGEFFEIIFDD